jgi:hypothetical protein
MSEKICWLNEDRFDHRDTENTDKRSTMKFRVAAIWFSLCTLFLCGETSFVFSASPSVGVVLPRGGQRGTEVNVSFNGGNLSDAQEVLVYYPGITVS